MRRLLPVLLATLACAGSARAQGHLLPTDQNIAPLHLVRHQVNVTIEDQVAVTKVVQTFRNDTSTPLEATYIFPVPKGASVKKFVMWVDGKEVPGELVEADKARQIYTDIVRRMQDPGLLEYVGNNLLKVRVYPVPAHGDQKLAISFTSIANAESGLVEYVYPLKTDANAARHLEQFSFEATLRAQHPIQNVYSPSHNVHVNRISDRHARISYECKATRLDKDFQLYYTAGSKDVGLTTLMHRPQSSNDGHFMMLISPRAELAKTQQVARDMVFVLDTSGSMQGNRILQAKKALQFCLRNLGPKDRFNIIHFATSVTNYQGRLLPATRQNIEEARRWVEELQPTGGTNINDALTAALDMRSNDTHRCFTVVFFTDGQPTVGEQNPEQIVKNVLARNTASTRIFTFGVGDDVNAVLLDQLAEKTRSVSTYVREHEDIEAKVSGLYSKISNPVLTNLKLHVGSNVTLTEMYPPQLPDLFHGSQLVVLGRYHGKGHAAVTLSGTVGADSKDFVYEVQFPNQTGKDKAFVEDLWARRKVGYLLDQIRVNGDKKELVDEVVRLAKKHGITTPYTSYLVVPDGVTPVAQVPGGSGFGPPVSSPPPVIRAQINPATQNFAPMQAQPIYYSGVVAGPTPTAPNTKGLVATAPQSQRIQFAPVFAAPQMQWAVPQSAPAPMAVTATALANTTGTGGFQGYAQSGKDSVDQSIQLNDLRTQNQVTATTLRKVAGRDCRESNGIWLDEGCKKDTERVVVKSLSAAYFRLLERHPELSEVFQLGNRVLWITPSGKALVIDTSAGQEQMSDEEIDRLFS